MKLVACLVFGCSADAARTDTVWARDPTAALSAVSSVILDQYRLSLCISRSIVGVRISSFFFWNEVRIHDMGR